MERNVIKTSVVASTSLEDKEGYAVNYAGALTTDDTKGCLGVVSMGRPAGEASEVIQHGRCTAQVDGSTTAIAAGDPLMAGSGGVFVKATIGTNWIRAYALEGASSATTIDIELL